MSSIQGSFTWILLTLLAVAGAFGLPGGELRKPVVAKPAPRVMTVETRVEAKGVDSQGRSLPFTVYVLTQQLSWKLESTNDLEGGATMLSPELILAINHASEVFCVGTASFEGTTEKEEERAAQRAVTLAQWVRGAIGNSVSNLFALNAGQYKGPSELESSHQRKAIILITGRHVAGVNLAEGLKSGLELQQEKSPAVYDLLHHYSRSKQWLQLPSVRR